MLWTSGKEVRHWVLFSFRLQGSQMLGPAEVLALDLTSSWDKSSWHRPGTNAIWSGSHLSQTSLQRKETRQTKPKPNCFSEASWSLSPFSPLPTCFSVWLYFPTTLKHQLVSWYRFAQAGKEVTGRDYSPCSVQHVSMLAWIPLLFRSVSYPTCYSFCFQHVLQQLPRFSSTS